MPEQPSATPAPAAQVQNSLHQLAQVLREVDHLEPEAQQSLADLVDQLSRTIKPEPAGVAEDTHLIAGVASLAQALRQGQSPGLLKAARQQLEQAAFRAEARTPLVSGIILRLLDALANLGI